MKTANNTEDESQTRRKFVLQYQLLFTRNSGIQEIGCVGEAETMRRRHHDYFLALAEEADSHFSGPAKGVWLDRLEAEHDNLRTVLTWSLTGETEGQRSGGGEQERASPWRAP